MSTPFPKFAQLYGVCVETRNVNVLNKFEERKYCLSVFIFNIIIVYYFYESLVYFSGGELFAAKCRVPETNVC